MTITIEPLASNLNFGRIVKGLKDAHLDDPDLIGRLKELWIEFGVFVFVEGDSNEEFQVRLSNLFGALELHPLKEYRSEKCPELITMASSPDDLTLMRVGSQVGAGYIGWHKDLFFTPKINKGGVLRALKVTSQGGRTGFIDQIEAYNLLPPDLKAAVEEKRVIYSLRSQDQMTYGSPESVQYLKTAKFLETVFERAKTDFPPVSHPLVFEQRETGRKILNFSPVFASYVEDMEFEESDALLQKLADHFFTIPHYKHSWSEGDMILWDNWRMLHSVTLFPPDEERVMQRTTIAGDYGFGKIAVLQEELVAER